MNTNLTSGPIGSAQIDSALNSSFNNSNGSKNYDELFKTILTIAVYVLKCSYRGFTYLFKDIPTLVWGKVSGSVNQAYQKSKNSTNGQSKVNSLVM